MKKLKVMIAAPMPPPDHGGIASWSRIVRDKFNSNQDIEVKFLDTTARYRSVTNLSLPVRYLGGSVQAIRDTWRIYRQLKNYRPNVFHLCTSGGPATLKDVIVLRVCKLLGVPSIIHYRMGRIPNIVAQNGAEWKLTSRAMCLADAVIPLDRNSEASIKTALPHVNVRKIPNLVEIDVLDRLRNQGDILPCPDTCLRLVFAGHVMPTKGLRELISACVKLSECHLVLDILGPADAEFQKELDEIAVQKQNGDWLRFHGAVNHDEAMRYIAAADLFLLPSYTEGMPNVVLEAMAYGRGIISTTVGAVPEMLDIGGPQECGICVAPRNADALADAIRRLVQNPQLREQMGLKARERAEQLYSVSVGCKHLVDLWSSIAK